MKKAGINRETLKKEVKVRGRTLFNVFDLVLIGAALLVLAVLLIASSGKDTTTVRYTVEVNNVPAGMSAGIKVGDEVMDNAKKYDIGVVESVEVVPYYITTTDQENGAVRVEAVPDRETALVHIVCEAQVTDTAITLDSGFLIRVGSSVNVKTSNFVGLGYIVIVEREEQ